MFSHTRRETITINCFAGSGTGPIPPVKGNRPGYRLLEVILNVGCNPRTFIGGIISDDPPQFSVCPSSHRLSKPPGMFTCTSNIDREPATNLIERISSSSL